MVAEQDVALGSAAVAVDRWQIQVGAMNKFEVGAISLHRLLVFWERTRPEADRRRDTFDAVSGPLRAPSSSCPSVARGASAQLRVCIVDAASRQAALGAARTAVDDWVAHEGRIGDVSAGRLSGAALKSHWLRTWRTVVRDLVDYHRAVRQLNGGSSCTV